MHRKRILNLLVSLVVVGLFILSSIIKPKLGEYTFLLRWLLILILLIANISLLGISKKKKWETFDWLELTTFWVVNIFLICLIISKAAFWFRMVVLILILITIFIPRKRIKKKGRKEVKKEAKILESAEKKLRNYIKGKTKSSKSKTDGASKKKYFASKKGSVFHKKGCKIGKRVSKRNRVYFSTMKEALKNGYKPCKVCIK